MFFKESTCSGEELLQRLGKKEKVENLEEFSLVETWIKKKSKKDLWIALQSLYDFKLEKESKQTLKKDGEKALF